MPISEDILRRIEENDPTLTVLYQYGLNDDDVEHLVLAMENNTHLIKLVFWGGEIPDVDYEAPERISARGAALLQTCKHLKELDLMCNPIRDAGAIALSKSKSITHLTISCCAVGVVGVESFYDNNVLHELWARSNIFSEAVGFDVSEWGKKIEKKLIENRGELEVIDYWNNAFNAMQEDTFEEFKRAVDCLPDGVNTYETTQNRETLLLSAATCNPRYTRYLLSRGANIESMNFQDYTALFLAAEEGEEKIVKLLLNRGSNITGEFYFNAEDAFSISAFKLNYFLVEWLDDLPDMSPLITKLKVKYLAGYFGFVGDRVPAWQLFGSHRETTLKLSKDAVSLIRQISKAGRDIPPKIQAYLNIFRLIHDKIALLQNKPMLWEDDYFASLENCAEYKIYNNLYPPQAEYVEVEERDLSSNLAELNTELKEKSELEIDWENYPRLFVAQYRCIHYYKHIFSDRQRREHIGTAHLNRMAPAPAVFSMSSLNPGQHQLLRESTAGKHREGLRAAFDDFKESGPVEVEGKQFANWDDALQEKMSNYYQRYNEDVRAGRTPPAQVLRDLNALNYPHYATADFTEHALRYGYGRKEVEAFKEHLLTPEYQRDATCRNSVLGKVFICLFTPKAMTQARMRNVAGAHNRGFITLRDHVVWERETNATGGIDSEYMFYEERLEMPNLSVWDESYVSKYGLSKERAGYFLKKLNAARDQNDILAIEGDLIDSLIHHMNRKLVLLAKEEAARQGGHLIYRHFDREYGLAPEPIRTSTGVKTPAQYERTALSSLPAIPRPTVPRRTLGKRKRSDEDRVRDDLDAPAAVVAAAAASEDRQAAKRRRLDGSENRMECSLLHAQDSSGAMIIAALQASSEPRHRYSSLTEDLKEAASFFSHGSSPDLFLARLANPQNAEPPEQRLSEEEEIAMAMQVSLDEDPNWKGKGAACP